MGYERELFLSLTAHEHLEILESDFTNLEQDAVSELAVQLFPKTMESCSVRISPLKLCQCCPEKLVE